MWGWPKVHSKVANPLSRVSIWGSQWWLWDVIPYNICNQTWVELNILSLPFWEINLLKEKTNFKTGGQSGLFRAMSCCSLFLERPNFKADRSKGKDRYFHWNVTLNNPNSPILCAPTEEGGAIKASISPLWLTIHDCKIYELLPLTHSCNLITPRLQKGQGNHFSGSPSWTFNATKYTKLNSILK